MNIYKDVCHNECITERQETASMKSNWEILIKKAHFIAMAKYLFRQGYIDNNSLNKLMQKIETHCV